MTAAMKVQRSCLQGFLLLTAVGLCHTTPLEAQALHTERLSNGTPLVVVAEPLSSATTVVWPAAAGEPISPVTSGDLTLIADLEVALSALPDGEAPPVVVVVGGASLAELRGMLERSLEGRKPATVTTISSDVVDEGRMERRLGSPGADAEIRLRVNLPPPSDPGRTSAEVLWDLVPEVLAGDLSGLRSRTDGDEGVLEARIDADRADLALKQLRLGLARIAEDPKLRDEQVEKAARRLLVKRRALLEKHPEAALLVLDLWLGGGTDAVREFLFAAEGVTPAGVREAARQWLPQHPGSVVVILPPHALNPRFASPPDVLQLEGGLTAAVLERSGSPLSVVCLRPVVVPDLDDEMAATILTRVAGELRASPQRPGWVQVTTTPPQLELAAPSAGFAELVEALRTALDTVSDDQRGIPFESGDSRRRALRLMAGVLGVAEGSELTPIALLRQDNLSLGVVAEDGEAAAEAIRKFWASGGETAGVTTNRGQPLLPKTREAVAGNRSSMVVAVKLSTARDEALPLVLAEILVARGSSLFPDHTVEVLDPFVPGRPVLLLVVTAVVPVDVLEKSLQKQWKTLTAPVNDGELSSAKRRVAASAAKRWSGATGRAARCAAVATGAVWWRPPAEMEMSILTVSAETVNLMLSGLVEWDTLEVVAAGVLPIVEVDK